MAHARRDCLHLQSACMESERRPTARAPSSSGTKRACNGDATCERIESDRKRICSRRSASHAFVSEWQAVRIEQENRRGLYVQIYYMMVGSYWCSLIDPCLLALAPGSSDQLELVILSCMQWIRCSTRSSACIASSSKARRNFNGDM